MNIFFLGAGFSQPAGLPLGKDLFSKVLEAAKEHGFYGGDFHGGEFKSDISEYLQYYYAKTGNEISENEINIEEFMSYIDIN